MDTEYKLREQARVVSEERRRNRAPGFLRDCADRLRIERTRHAPEFLLEYTYTPTIYICVNIKLDIEFFHFSDV